MVINEKELLEAAKIRYPIGTKYFALNTDVEIVVTNDIFKNNGGVILDVNDLEETHTPELYRNVSRCVYAYGRWAEIVSKPEIIFELW